MFGIAPALLDRAEHTGKLHFPMTFPHPYPRAPTGFVCYQDIYLCPGLGRQACRPNRIPLVSPFPTQSLTRPYTFLSISLYHKGPRRFPFPSECYGSPSSFVKIGYRSDQLLGYFGTCLTGYVPSLPVDLVLTDPPTVLTEVDGPLRPFPCVSSP